MNPINLILENAKKEERKILYPVEAETVLAYYGINSVQGAYCRNSLDEISEAANRIGFPVAIKLISSEIPHKSDAGYVKLRINGMDALATAHDDILQRVNRLQPDAQVQGILIQRMIEDGHEVIIGLSRDPTFGKIIMFGLGGIFVEILKDIAIRKLPISPLDARDMIEEIKGFRILQGARGKEPANLKSLEDVLLKSSRLGEEIEEIVEMDLNPVFVNPHCSLVADARIIIK